MSQKSSHISGFPELLPEERLVESRMIDVVRSLYESFGYTPIETSAVENLSALLSKGSDDKEIYAVHRHAPEAGTEASTPELGLHFDLTVPFARYTAQNAGVLTFPFKRHQIQKCWRGERPQEGRFREFCQADVDVVSQGELPLHCDAEVLEIALRALHAIAPGLFTVRVNSRKLVEGLAAQYGLDEQQRRAFTAGIDKLHKIGEAKCRHLLDDARVPGACVELVLEAHARQVPLQDAVAQLDSLGDTPKLREGIAELRTIANLLPAGLARHAVFDPCIVRGLDYYTGVIFEAALDHRPELSVCGGGRYDNLCENLGTQPLPGVGMSIGISRLFALLRQSGHLHTSASTTSRVLLVALDESQRPRCRALANELRSTGIACEEHLDFRDKPGKQIQYALRKGIGHVLFVEDDGTLQLKDLEARTQVPVALPDIPAILRGAGQD